MVRGVILLAAILVALASPLRAGPWAREPGQIFLSYSLNAESSRSAIASGDVSLENYHSLYGEVGLGRRLTAGLDLGRDDRTRMNTGYLRYTLTQPASRLQFAIDLGAGQRNEGGGSDFTFYRAGGSVGYGFGGSGLQWIPLFEPDGGWLSLDTVYLADPESDWSVWQAEATLGMNISEQFAGLFQIKAEEWPGADLAVTVTPSLLWQFSEANSLQIGAQLGVSGDETVGLRLGLWRDF